ncbi:MAG: hypothetical protein QOE55_7100 [Acidobacteriaceae bacterium]|nr:hypothetical protein [Acidobacteriaceae bacterium]
MCYIVMEVFTDPWPDSFCCVNEQKAHLSGVKLYYGKGFMTELKMIEKNVR